MSTDAAWQPLLWPADESTDQFGPWPPGARRALSRGAWIDHVPGWFRGADALVERLRHDTPWRAGERTMYERVVAVPRLTAWYPEIGRIGDAALTACRDELVAHYRCADDPFVSAGLCLYRDGRDSVAWHGDRIGRGRSSDTMVAVLSLGSPRAFLLRPDGGGDVVRLSVGHGDLVVMGGTCQRTWEHAVPKSRSAAGPRISVQFRQRGVA